MSDRPIAVIGAPTDVGAGHRGGSMGPEALRVAGLVTSLEHMGLSVRDEGNLSGPVNPGAPPVDGYRHLAEVKAWCELVRDAVYGVLREGAFPLLLGGDHCLAIGSLAAVARQCAEQDRPLWLLWLDAHADFNTPESTPSGNVHGMPVAFITGHGHPDLAGIGHAVPMLESSRIIQVGIRSVDAVEKRKVNASDMTVYDMRRIDELGMRAVMTAALEAIARTGGHLHVSFDVDFLDPTIAPGVGTTVPGGPTYREAQLCMEMIYDSGLMGSLDVMELNPAWDTRNQTAKLAVELVESLFGEQILARKIAAEGAPS